MKCKEQFSLANDCTEIEYWKQLRHYCIFSPTLKSKSYSIRGKRLNIPLSEINLPNIPIKQKTNIMSISNRGV